MAQGDQINLKPHFKKEGPTLPCDGKVGDLYVFSPFEEDERDPSATGKPRLWFCTKSSGPDGQNAVWARIAFDDARDCTVPPTMPPDYPRLKEG